MRGGGAIRELRGLQTRVEVGDELLEAGGVSIESRIILAAGGGHGRSKNCEARSLSRGQVKLVLGQLRTVPGRTLFGRLTVPV